MKAFREGRRNFKPDEIVYVIDDSLDCQCNISDIGDIILYGKVSSYCGYGEYYIDLYTPIESIFTDCLITFLDDDSIRKAFREGFLIPRSSIKDWKNYILICLQAYMYIKIKYFIQVMKLWMKLTDKRK